MIFELRNFRTNGKYFVLLFFVLLTNCITAQSTKHHSLVLVITNINVVDVVSGAVRPGVTIIIKNGKIDFIGKLSPGNIPPN